MAKRDLNVVKKLFIDYIRIKIYYSNSITLITVDPYTYLLNFQDVILRKRALLRLKRP